MRCTYRVTGPVQVVVQLSTTVWLPRLPAQHHLYWSDRLHVCGKLELSLYALRGFLDPRSDYERWSCNFRD